MCEMYNFPVAYSGDEATDSQSIWNSQEIIEDKVILETEITLRTGPNITMKIHEESRSNSVISGSEEDSRKQGVIKILNDDSESDFYEEITKSPKTPRKVRFGGESFKLRTPESDSSHQADDDDNEVSIIKITVTDAVSITTKRSLIPIRISSLPSTPKKRLPYQMSSRSHYRSAPNLSSSSKIPLRKKTALEIQRHSKKQETGATKLSSFYKTAGAKQGKLNRYKSPIRTGKMEREHSPTHPKLTIPLVTPKLGRPNDVTSPIPVHNEIELFHNLTRSPERKRKNSMAVQSDKDGDTNEKDDKTSLVALYNAQNQNDTSLVKLESNQNEANTKNNTNKEIDLGNNHHDTKVSNNQENKTNGFRYNGNSFLPLEGINITNIGSAVVKLSNGKLGPSTKSIKDTEEIIIIKEENEDVPDEKKYNSFTVYNDNGFNTAGFNGNGNSVIIEEIVEIDSLDVNNGKKPTLQQSLSTLASEEEIWAKSEALESLINMLKQPGTCESLEAGPAALLFEAIFACHHRDRLHNLADDALTVLIEGLHIEVLEQCLPRLSLALCKMGVSSGVRLALVVMKRLAPKKLQAEILGKGFGHRTREGSLQILMACARVYPKADVEMEKIAEFASSALKDRRRRVRHAALETLAAVAQITSASEVLNTVSNTIKDLPDTEEVLQVVRTRLSRKQLPTIDFDGTIRYSSPIDQVETDWISGSILKNNHMSDSSPLSSASSSTPSVNYWMHNVRHQNTFGNGSPLMQRLSAPNEDAFEDPTKIWVADGPPFLKNGKVPKGQRAGVLRPVYILQPEVAGTNTGRGHRKYDRGRSFSPPKYQRGQYRTGIVEGLPIHTLNNNNNNGEYAHHNKNFVHPDIDSRLQYPEKGRFQTYGGFRKSFSSDQLYFSERLPAKHEPYSHSLSSRSSSTSTGSSTKSGFWHKDFRSGIPIPISENKLKIKHSSTSSLLPAGPLVAKRSAIASPQRTPVSLKTSPRERTSLPPEDNDSVSRLSLALLPPHSSGSESSGYFTPSPPDTHQPAFIKMDTEERLSSDNEGAEDELECSVDNNGTERVDSFSVKSVVSEEHEQRNALSSAQLIKEALGEQIDNSFPSVESINLNNSEDIIEPRTPSNSSIALVQSRPSTIEGHRKSKSVVDLQSFLPDINPRKSSNSAPPRNDENSLNNNTDTTSDVESYEPPIEAPSVLPLSPMDYTLHHQEEEEEEEVFTRNEIPKSKLGRRFLRHHSRKSIKSSPRLAVEPVVSRPVSKPKETLHHILTELESPVWETTVQGLHDLTKLTRQHPEVIENQIHQVCLVLAKQVKNLRSQVSRTACNTAGELFLFCKRGLDMELEEIAAPLFQRTADTNKFLRADANAALDIMCEQLPVSRVIYVVTARGCGHQNAVVRATGVRLLCNIVKKMGPERVFQMPKELRDKILIAGANSLTDGNLDARSYGKTLYRHLMVHPCFQRYLLDAVPQNILRHISKVLSSIKTDIS